MESVFRNDYVTVRDPRIDSGGMLRTRATIARIGVQDYLDKAGKLIREFRSPEEVAKSAPTFNRIPVTIDHPPTAVDAINSSQYLKGLTADVEYSDGLLETELTVTHQDAVQVALSTHRQLSCGYTCQLVEESGVWIDDQGLVGEPGAEYPYDCKQVNIEGNHVALVPRGRAGAVASIKDKNDCFTIKLNDHPDEKSMTQFVYEDSILAIDGTDAEKVAELVKSLKADKEQLEADAIAVKAELESVKAELEASNGRADALQVKVDEAQPVEIKTDAQVIKAEVVARLQARADVAGKVEAELIADMGLSAEAIHKVYLKSVAPKLADKIDSADSAYISALWDVLCPQNNVADSTAPLEQALESAPVQDSAPKLDSATVISNRRKAYLKNVK